MKSPVSAALLGVWLLAGASVQAEDIITAAEERQAVQECALLLERPQAQHALQTVKVQLQSQGLKLQTVGCPFVRVRGGKMQQVMEVRVWVTDSDSAAYFVRGPLADGETVDMGDVQLAQMAASAGDTARVEDLSPDVLFNRQWLSSVMQARGFSAVEGHWWAFVPSTAQ